MDTKTIRLSVPDMAYILGVTRATIYNRQRAGQLNGGDDVDTMKTAIAFEKAKVEAMEKRLREVVLREMLKS